MAVSEDAAVVLAAKFVSMRRLGLTERQWREYLGIEARALGHGGVRAVAKASGASETTVAAGVRETGSGGPDVLPPGRSRRPGGGRKKLADAEPGLRQELRSLLEGATRGDPMAEIMYCSLSVRDIARKMTAAGWACGKDMIARLLREEGYSLQSPAKVLEGSAHPDRGAQFDHINARIAQYRASGDPVVSVDGKKKEYLGPYWRAGRAWRPAGDPVRVRDHDFHDEGTVRITPYGVYDIAANRGFVSVGTGCDTPAFAVNALRLWWQEDGSLRYRHARRLLVTCDAGGSNGCRCRLWKDQLAVFAAQAGLPVEVVHFPPGTSKWNKIEHRLFCHITRAWRARPLMTIDDAVAGIAATATAQGLKCHPVRDDDDYPGGVTVSDQRMRYLEDRIIDRDPFHGDWNYTVLPAPRQAAEPGPAAPARPGGVRPGVLNSAALTGMRPEDVTALAAALDVPFGARREQRNHARRGRPRVNAVKNGDGSNGHRKIDVTGHVLALRLHDHLRLPGHVIGALLGVDRSTISHATSLTRRLLSEHAISLPPAAPQPCTRLRTLEDLREYATAAGITLAMPETTPKQPS
jgi:hypothetical protein